MSSDSSVNPNNGLTLQQIDSQRAPDSRTREGKSGDITYKIESCNQDESKIDNGKIIEIGTLEDTEHQDLQPLSNEGFTHYGIFRVSDRSTTTIVQDESKATHKIYSFSRNDVKIGYQVRLTKLDS